MTTAPVRSYHARRGRLTPAMVDALERLGPRYAVGPGLDVPERGAGRPIDLGALVPGAARWVLEIGPGMGDATIALAHADPSTAILAVEVHTRGVARLLNRLDAEGVTNVRVAHGDAVVVLEDLLAPSSLDGVRLWFPDPWPKARHHKRRLVQPAFAALVASRLRPGGLLHAATDWAPYAEHMREVLGAEPALRELPGALAAGRVVRPRTPYEQAGLDAGRDAVDLVYERVAEGAP